MRIVHFLAYDVHFTIDATHTAKLVYAITIFVSRIDIVHQRSVDMILFLTRAPDGMR